jgi:ribosomal protein L10
MPSTGKEKEKNMNKYQVGRMIMISLKHSPIEPARVVKDNLKTVWVKLRDGNIIKRHKMKHLKETK